MERRTQKDAQELKVLATKPKNLSLLSGIHMVEYIIYIHIYIMRWKAIKEGSQHQPLASSHTYTSMVTYLYRHTPT